MFKRFFPPQEDFFKLFRAATVELEHAAHQFVKMMKDLNQTKKYAAQISLHEKAGDKIAHTIYQQLHATFITPFDRYDIHHFTSQLDDILDCLHENSRRIYIYHLESVPQQMIALSQLCLEAAQLVAQAVEQLHDLKNMQKIIGLCAEINQVENKAEAVLLNGVTELFETETDIKRLLKIKEVYEDTKEMIDGCQDLANIMKGIVLEYS